MMINDFLWPQLDVIDLDNVCFQRDDAMCHNNHETIDLLSEKFLWNLLYFLLEN